MGDGELLHYYHVITHAIPHKTPKLYAIWLLHVVNTVIFFLSVANYFYKSIGCWWVFIELINHTINM